MLWHKSQVFLPRLNVLKKTENIKIMSTLLDSSTNQWSSNIWHATFFLMSLQVSLVLKFDQTYNYSVLFYLYYIVLVATLAYYHYLIKKLHNRPSGCNISSVSTSFLFRLRVVAASYLPVICCCFYHGEHII